MPRLKFPRLGFGHVRWLALFGLIGSEALVGCWLWLAVTGRAPGLLGLAGVALGVLALNAGALGWVGRGRGRGRRRRGLFAMNRLWMVGSLGALATGPLLALAFAVGGVLLLTSTALGAGSGGAEGVMLAGGGLAVATGFGSMLWGYLVGQRRVQVDRVELPMRDLPPQLAGLRIAHITDLHIGPLLGAAQLRGFIERVNELEPDLIAITGDIFDFDPAFIEEGCRELGKLHARHGIFGVLGNHDVYTGVDAVVEGITRLTSIRMLRNEWVELEIDGARLCLAGIDDPGRGWDRREAENPDIERLSREMPDIPGRILLVHRPSFFAQSARLGIPVSLAGHTHGGQISLPRAHHQNIARLIAPWTRGLFENGDSLLYVNRGLGVAGPPIRLNCPREIALLRLVARRS